jgi:hypothetical protein
LAATGQVQSPVFSRALGPRSFSRAKARALSAREPVTACQIPVFHFLDPFFISCYPDLPSAAYSTLALAAVLLMFSKYLIKCL